MADKVEHKTFTIEKNIPFPEKVKRWHIYPIGELEVGDSFFVEGKKTSTLGSSIRFHQRNGKIFVCSNKSKPDGVRVWRVT